MSESSSEEETIVKDETQKKQDQCESSDSSYEEVEQPKTEMVKSETLVEGE